MHSRRSSISSHGSLGDADSQASTKLFYNVDDQNHLVMDGRGESHKQDALLAWECIPQSDGGLSKSTFKKRNIGW